MTTPTTNDAWTSPSEAGPSAPAIPSDVNELRQRAATAAYIGAAAAVAGMFTCVGSCFSVLAAGILGGIATQMALAVRREDDGEDSGVAQLSNVALLTGISSVSYAVIFFGFLLLYIMAYVVIFGVIIATEGL